MSLLSRPGAALLALSLALPGPALAARHPAAGAWVPDPKDAQEGLSIRGERVSYRGDALQVEIELLDARRRRLFLASAGLPDTDPFHEDVIGWRVFTFLVRLENTGDAPLQIRPQSFFFITRRPVSQSTPCDFLCLRAAAEKSGLDRAAADRLVRASLDTSESILPGERLSKLLVYTRMPDAFKEFVLDLDGLSLAGERLRMTVPYRAVLEEKGKKRAGGAP